MIIDFALLAAFIGSFTTSLWFVGRKIPLLLAVPENLIRESFVTRPPHLKRYTRPLIAFFEEERYKDICYAFLIRTLRRVRITLLKLERISFRLLQSLQARVRALPGAPGFHKNPNGSADINSPLHSKPRLRELRRWKYAMKRNGNGIPNAVLNPEPPPEAKESS